MRDPIDEFMRFNRPFARRNPELLRLKVARMAEGPFAFFRGTFHLFARDVIESTAGPLPLFGGGGAELELVGDIHSENFGTYKAADGAVHYDVNDFDETTTGRFDFDVCRLATSWLLAAQERKDPLEQAVPVSLAGLVTYADTLRRLLKKGKGAQHDVSETTPSGCGPVDDLIAAGAAAKRPAFINRLTERSRRRPPFFCSVSRWMKAGRLAAAPAVSRSSTGPQPDGVASLTSSCGPLPFFSSRRSVSA